MFIADRVLGSCSVFVLAKKPILKFSLSVRSFSAKKFEKPVRRMRAVVTTESGGFDVLKTVSGFPKPQILEPDQVLIKNEFAGVNYIDTYHRNGMYPVKYPFIPGQEGAGTIVAVGENVFDFNVGDRVAYLAGGSCAEFTVAPAKNSLSLPSSISTQAGAALLLQGMTAAYLTTLSHAIKPGQWVLVPAAAGGTGSLICRMAKRMGGRVIAIVGSAYKAEVALASGAAAVINHRTEDITACVMSITNNYGVDVVYDGAGQALYKVFLACMAQHGSYVNFGNASGKIESVDPFDLTPKCLRFMRPSLFGYNKTREDFLTLSGQVLSLLEKQPDCLLIHKIYDLDDLGQAHEDLESGKTVGKLLIRV
jgi:NADPH2:quinone reductase